MIIITTDDFTGFHAISKTCRGVDALESYISDYEFKFLCRLLGDELAILFVDDLVNMIPQSDRFLAIYNEFCKIIEDSCTCEKEIQDSFGMKSMMLGLIYYVFVSDQPYVNTITGTVSNDNSNSEVLNTTDLLQSVNKRWNRSAQSYEAIQTIILDDEDLYPEFNGIEIEVKFLDLL